MEACAFAHAPWQQDSARRRLERLRKSVRIQPIQPFPIIIGISRPFLKQNFNFIFKRLKIEEKLENMEQAAPIKEKPSRKSTLEETKTIKEDEKKKSMKIMDGSMDLPVEILVKIFNFLPNHDIRCGVSLTCKIFQKICQDESLVPVKDLCIHGDKQLSYDLRDFEDVSDIIVRSKSLTSLKIKALNLETAKRLVHIAFEACPKLIHVEIVEPSEMPPSGL